MRPMRALMLFCTALFTLVLVAACAPEVRQVSPIDPTPVGTTPDDDILPQPEGTPTTWPGDVGGNTENPAEEGSNIITIARQALMQELQLDTAAGDNIEVVEIEQVEWPDACLGVQNPDEMCAQVITPGYRVVLAYDGEQYVYHTDLDGASVRLAEAPQASIQNPSIIFETQNEACTAAQIGTTGVAFGPCGGVQTVSDLVVPERADQLAELATTFAPFTARTDAGSVDFYGAGTTEATPAQQRMIAEWARTVLMEAQSGRTENSLGLAFAWHREGGIAGFCEDVTAYATGRLDVTSCRGQEPETIEARWLTAEELAQIYAWQDRFAPFETVQTDDAITDSMTVRLVFSANGETLPTAEEQQAILDFAAALYVTAAQ